DLTTLLISAAQQESQRLEHVRSRLIEVAEVVPLGTSVLAAATQYQRTHGLSPQDALVYSSVLTHLKRVRASENCFLNRDKGFGDQNIVEELAGYNCQLFVQFDAGYSFIRGALG
ncbi:MAG: PIN domain-containing protein, partial [Deltaproteobacteria bacterium]|nr:PIN domain-containing protein [Deltaproteobacteria bacterium]